MPLELLDSDQLHIQRSVTSNLLHNRDRHFHTFFRIIPLIACRVDDLVGYTNALRHFAKHGVLAVQESRILDHDEKLGAGRIRISCSGHRNNATFVWDITELRLDGMTRTALSIGILLSESFS